MQLFVYLIAGSTITIDCEDSDTIEEIKRKIESRTSISTDHQHLFFDNVQLEDHRILSDLGIRHRGKNSIRAFRMAGNGCEWMGMAANGWEWMRMDGNGCEWMGMDANGCEWMRMVANG
ncbi:unnamed protein product, partial [Rotaria magnacalcarata]